MGPTLGKRHARDVGKYFDAERRDAHAVNPVRLQELLCGHALVLETEGAQNVGHTLRVFQGLSDPDVHIACCAWVAVKDDGVAADEQILNAVRIQQFQEVFEVVWEQVGIHR